MKKVFKYIEPIWLGKNGKVSIRSVLALAFSWNFIWNLSYAIKRWDAGRSMSDLAMILGVEAGLIAGLLALRTYQNTQADNKEAELIKEKCVDPSFIGSAGGKIGTE